MNEDRIMICDMEMAEGALRSIQELLDSGGIPRGTYPDDQVRNLVAMYNNALLSREVLVWGITEARNSIGISQSDVYQLLSATLQRAEELAKGKV